MCHPRTLARLAAGTDVIYLVTMVSVLAARVKTELFQGRGACPEMRGYGDLTQVLLDFLCDFRNSSLGKSP